MDRCEEVWAESISFRGESLVITLSALKAAGFDTEAWQLAAVSGDGHGKAWEQYARQTFLAHTCHTPLGEIPVSLLC